MKLRLAQVLFCLRLQPKNKCIVFQKPSQKPHKTLKTQALRDVDTYRTTSMRLSNAHRVRDTFNDNVQLTRHNETLQAENAELKVLV